MSKQIKFKDLIRVLRKNIKRIALITLVFAIVGAGAGVVFKANSVQPGEDSAVEQDQTQIDYLQAQIDLIDNWFVNGCFMKINAAHMAVCDMVFTVTSNEADIESKLALEKSISTFYVSEASSNYVKDKILEEVGDRAVIDFMDFEYTFLCTPLGDNAVKITIRHYDLDSAEIVAEAAFKVLDAYGHQTYDNYGTNLVSSNTAFVLDGNINTTQSDTTEHYEGLKNTLAGLQGSLFSGDSSSGFKKIIIYGILGGIMGFIISYMLFIVLYANMKSPGDIRDLNDRYNIKVLGAISKNGPKSGKLNKADGTGYSNIEAIKASLGIISKDKTILITGSIHDSQISELCEALTTSSEQEIICGGCVQEHAQTIEKLRKADAVILLEQLGVSQYERINEQIITMECLDKEILAFIVIQ